MSLEAKLLDNIHDFRGSVHEEATCDDPSPSHVPSPLASRSSLSSSSSASASSSTRSQATLGSSSPTSSSPSSSSRSAATQNQKSSPSPSLSRTKTNTNTNTITNTNTKSNTKSKTKSKNTKTKSKTVAQAEDPVHLWQRLKTLQTLQDAGTISAEEHATRKQQIIDQLTGTKLKLQSNATNHRTHGRRDRSRVDIFAMEAKFTVPRPPPDFATIPPEPAIMHVFDIRTGLWSQSPVSVKIESEPFARGSLRVAYHMDGLQHINSGSQSDESITSQSSVNRDTLTNTNINTNSNSSSTGAEEEGKEGESGEGEKSISYVCKISIDPFEERESYFQDVATQMFAKEYAAKYNQYRPPKKVAFVKAWLLELTDRPNRPICCVERFITGPYRKHNNNFGYVSEEERNTPQAFSHFTYEASSHNILVCDIQGVGDLYTDPQIHSMDGQSFGKGNMGERGIKKFLASHRCNAICRYLKLPPVNNKSQLIEGGSGSGGVEVGMGGGGATMMDNGGTMPATRYMSYTRVEVIHLQLDTHQLLAPLKKKIEDIGEEEEDDDKEDEEDEQTVCCSCCIIL